MMWLPILGGADVDGFYDGCAGGFTGGFGFLSSHPSTRNLSNYVEVLNVLAIDDYACTVRRLLICEYNLYYMLGNQQLDKSETNLCKVLIQTSLCGTKKTCVCSDAWHICMRIYNVSTLFFTAESLCNLGHAK